MMRLLLDAAFYAKALPNHLGQVSWLAHRMRLPKLLQWRDCIRRSMSLQLRDSS